MQNRNWYVCASLALCSTFNRINWFIYVLFADPVTPKPCAFYRSVQCTCISLSDFVRKSLEPTFFLAKFSSANWLHPKKRDTKSKAFVCAFVPLAFYPIIIGCVGFVSLTTRLLCGWKKEFGSNSYLIWLFVSYLLVKDRRRKYKQTHGHRELFKPEKFKEERRQGKLCNSQKSIRNFYVH